MGEEGMAGGGQQMGQMVVVQLQNLSLHRSTRVNHYRVHLQCANVPDLCLFRKESIAMIEANLEKTSIKNSANVVGNLNVCLVSYDLFTGMSDSPFAGIYNLQAPSTISLFSPEMDGQERPFIKVCVGYITWSFK
jgi:hypothetical protein